MKVIKKNTGFTLSRDIIRLLAVAMFIGVVFLGFNVKVESEYAIIASVILLGPFFCGWICPMGGISYFMNRLGRKLLPKLQFNLPPKIDRPLRYLRYVFMVFFLALLLTTTVNKLAGLNLYGMETIQNVYRMLMPVAVILIPFFSARFFCKYLCWHKGYYNLVSRLFRFTKIERDVQSCIGCNKCNRACPMTIRLSTADKVCGVDCISCFNCLDKDVCPTKEKSLVLRWCGHKVDHLNFSVIALAGYIIITAGVVYLTNVI